MLKNPPWPACKSFMNSNGSKRREANEFPSFPRSRNHKLLAHNCIPRWCRATEEITCFALWVNQSKFHVRIGREWVGIVIEFPASTTMNTHKYRISNGTVTGSISELNQFRQFACVRKKFCSTKVIREAARSQGQFNFLLKREIGGLASCNISQLLTVSILYAAKLN